jgi:hypothetical protein
MKNDYNSFYYLQIPKCGGTYLNNMVVEKLDKILNKNKKVFIDGKDHSGWKQVDNCYIMSCLRDPVKRTVSHYAHYKKTNFKKVSEPLVLKFMNWVETNINFISNYQAKNFLYTQKDNKYNIYTIDYNIDPDFLSIKIEKEIVLQKIKNINILLKDKQLTYEMCGIVFNKILTDFNISGPSYIDNNVYDHNVTAESKKIYELLTKKEIDYLYEINNFDSELYFSESLYFKNNEC